MVKKGCRAVPCILGNLSCGALLGCRARTLAVQAYQEIEQRLVSETVFSQYMYKTLPSCNHLWAFKKQFCCQMALSGEHFEMAMHLHPALLSDNCQPPHNVCAHLGYSVGAMPSGWVQSHTV